MNITNLAEMEAFATDFAQQLQPKETATVIALHGDLGAGKTTFTQFLARALGVTQSLNSPTFVLMKRYPLEAQPFDNLFHVDAYRLDNADDLRKLDFESVLAEPKNLVVIEWPERVADLIPDTAQKLNFTFINETTREVNYG